MITRFAFVSRAVSLGRKAFFSFKDQVLGNFLSSKSLSLEELLSIIPCGIVVLDKGSRVSYVNASAQEMGFRRGSLYLLPSDFQSSLATHEAPAFSKFSLKIKGRDHLFLAQSAEVGKRKIMIYHDISRLQELEMARRICVELLAHETRTPLTSLLMATRLLVRALAKQGDGADQTLAQNASHDVERLHTTVNQLIDILKGESFGSTLQKQEVNLTKLMSNIVNSLKLEFENIEWSLEFLPQKKTIIAEIDPVKLTWVILKVIKRCVESRENIDRVDLCIEYLDERVDIRVFGRSLGMTNDEFGGVEKDSAEFNLTKKIIEEHGGLITEKIGPDCILQYDLRLPLRPREASQAWKDSTDRSAYQVKGATSGAYSRSR